MVLNFGHPLSLSLIVDHIMDSINFLQMLQHNCIVLILVSLLCSLQEFLKKEFSEENIVFWLECESYKAITDDEKVWSIHIVLYTQTRQEYSFICTVIQLFYDIKQLT